MKKLILSTALGVFLLPSPASAAKLFEATVNSAQQVPPNSSTATGTANLTLNDAKDRLEISIQLFGVDLGGQTPSTDDDVVSLHFHRAPAGNNGPVVFGLISPNNDLNGDLVIDPVAGTAFSAWDLNEGNGTTLAAELDSLFSGNLYLNVHTTAFPNGEIRGQVQATPESSAVFGLLALSLVGLQRRFRFRR